MVAWLGDGGARVYAGGRKGVRKPATFKELLPGPPKMLLALEAFSSGPFCSTGLRFIWPPMVQT